MPNPYDPESENNYNWYFNTRSGEWIARLKKNKQRMSIKPVVEVRASPNGIEIRKIGSEKWIPASEIVGQSNE